VIKDLKDKKTSIRQWNSRTSLRIGDDWRGNTIWNVKTNIVDFIDENIDIDINDYDFASMRNRDQFGQNQIQKNVSFG
jgi:hypothetical protein